MAVMRCPEKGSPKRLSEAYDLKEIGGGRSVSTKAYLSGRKRQATTMRPGTRAALYLRVSTADQKPDLQYGNCSSGWELGRHWEFCRGLVFC